MIYFSRLLLVCGLSMVINEAVFLICGGLSPVVAIGVGLALGLIFYPRIIRKETL